MTGQKHDKIHQVFREECTRNAREAARDPELRRKSLDWLEHTCRVKYPYNFTWMGRPIIQFPQDIVAMQELVWAVKPDLIIETGVAHGGSLVLSASLLTMLDVCEAIESGIAFDPRRSRRRVIGVDIDIRAHNRDAIETHPMGHMITLIQGSSISPETVAQVREASHGGRRVLVCLDSMHTHDHVLAELQAYATLVTPGSYLCVFDTMIEDLPKGSYADRPWNVGDNPKTAVHAWLKTDPGFAIDRDLQDKLLVTVAPDGFLKRIR